MQGEDFLESSEQESPRTLWKLVASSSIIASMCCLPSVVLVMFGIATVSTGAALSDTLYWGEDGYSWFRPLMLTIASITVIMGLVFYFRNQGICTIDQAKRQRRKIINTSIIVIIVSYLSYLLLNYVILTELGILFGLPWESSRVWNKQSQRLFLVVLQPTPQELAFSIAFRVLSNNSSSGIESQPFPSPHARLICEPSQVQETN